MVRSPWHPQQFQCLETHLRQSKDVKGELATVVYNFWYDEECHFQCSFYCVLYSIELHEFTLLSVFLSLTNLLYLIPNKYQYE
jgi:hypothetical protein